MFKRITAITLAFVGAFALVAPSAQGAPSKADDCLRVAKADRPLCRVVQGQLPYAYATDSGLNQVVSGRKLVREITHQGLTKREMHSYLVGEANAYLRHVVTARSVVLDMDSLRKHHGTDAEFVVGFEDADGKPGGAKSVRVELKRP